MTLKFYIAGDEDPLMKYQHLFPLGFNPDLKFFTFQQAVFKDRIPSIPADELSAVNGFISKQYKVQKNLVEHPWDTMRMDEFQPEADLQWLYVEWYVYSPLMKLIHNIPSTEMF